MNQQTPEGGAFSMAFHVALRLAACFLTAVILPAAQCADTEFFEKEVRPLLIRRCYSCHSGTKTSGGLALDSRQGWENGSDSGKTIVPGNPRESLLIDAINYLTLQMPPPDKGGKLTDAEIGVLTRWVEQGAIDPRTNAPQLGGMTTEQAKSWWAFQPLPSVEREALPQQIDEFVDAAVRRHNLRTAAPADKRTLIRRVTYGLTGLPPTAAEVADFLDDDSDAAFDTVISRLLNSPQYGAHWGRRWLDIVRYADTAGENTDRPLPHAWRYRNWVLDAFNRDMPFDEFVRLQIAGDITAADSSPEQKREGIVATGYLAIARRFGHDIDKDIHLMYEDVIDNVGKNFLGLTFGCARCHDHKYDPITSSDYYALYGIFDSTKFSFPGCEPRGQPKDLVPLIDKAVSDAMVADYQQRLAAWERPDTVVSENRVRLKQLAAQSFRILASSKVEEGKEVRLTDVTSEDLDSIPMRKGEVLQLAVQPNAGHGADTTRIELEILRTADGARWDVAELIPRFLEKGPMIRHNGAAWCFLDVEDGPAFLTQKKSNLNGKANLHAWASGDTPSVTVNASADPVTVWTTLPGHSFFVHPGHHRDAGLAWVCPADGRYQVRGLVADGHPAPGLDGVSFRLEHFASPELGAGLIAMGEIASTKKAPKPEPPVFPVAYAVMEAEAKNARLHERGDPEQPGKEIPRRWLTVFGGRPVSADKGSGRLELADWIVEHPLFARVMVNRIWQWHFGRGLVATPNDFGSRGEPPTHPELLNWLAAQFRAGGYRIKPLHHLILTSAAWQRSTGTDSAEESKDPENQWLTRFSRRRLTAEEIRDSLLTFSGVIDLSVGEAHPFPPESEWKFTQHAPFNAIYRTTHRSVFLMVQRQRRHPYLALFDGADPNSTTAVRETTTVPTQALYFLNDSFFHAQAAMFADRVIEHADETSRVSLMFQRLFQRLPTEQEIQITSRLLSQYPGKPADRWSALARILMASNECLYVD